MCYKWRSVSSLPVLLVGILIPKCNSLDRMPRNMVAMLTWGIWWWLAILKEVGKLHKVGVLESLTWNPSYQGIKAFNICGARYLTFNPYQIMCQISLDLEKNNRSFAKHLPLDSHRKCGKPFLDWNLLTVSMFLSFLGLWWVHWSPVYIVYNPSAFVNKLFELDFVIP